MTKLKRNISTKKIKILFALSGNQCAHPDCNIALIESATEDSSDAVIGEICHIYAYSINGPRGKPGLTEKELNSLDNLLVLCPNHHTLVDSQPETYNAEILKDWKQNHKSKIEKLVFSGLDTNQPRIFSHPSFPNAIIDQKIEDEIRKLRKARFFAEFDRVGASLLLARRITDGELSGGTDTNRCRGLAWCVRLLSLSDEIEKAEKYLELAKGLGTCLEVTLAEAFVLSRKNGKRAGLKVLAKVDSALSRSAALMIVSDYDSTEDSVAWFEDAISKPECLCSDGKFILLMQQLKLGRWNAAEEIVKSLSDCDLEETPILHHAKAITHLLAAVPKDFRRGVLTHVPFEAANFPLASDEAGIETRRTARWHFVEAVKAAEELDCPDMAMESEKFALWLELKDPQQSEFGRKRLEQRLRDKKFALHVVHLGLHFGIELDSAVIEKEIDKQIALHGEISLDGALARLALAFTRTSPEEVVKYVEQHYEDLTKHINKKALLFIQVEFLSKAGLAESAMKCLESFPNDGLTESEEAYLRSAVAKAEDFDFVEVREQQFKKSDSLGDLIALIDELQVRQDWERLCEFAPILFERTKSIREAEQLATALSNTNKSKQLVELVQHNPHLLGQSRLLVMLYAWALYNEGELIESRSEMLKLDDGSDDSNYRALQLELGVAIGDWDALNSLVENDFQHRDTRSMQELINAAQLALRLGSPHSRDLVFSAAEKGKDDAVILANAYYLASYGGWEHDAQVTQWLIRAAKLSGEEGPLQMMSLKDLVDLKPEWDRQNSQSWKMLSGGKLPVFLAAQSLNKSLIELTLFPAIANQNEQDARKKQIIPSYSGAHQRVQFDLATVTVGFDATTLITLAFLNILDKTLDAFKVIYVPHSTLAWLFEEKQRVTFHQPSRIRQAHQILHLLATDKLQKFVPSTTPDSELAAQIGDELASMIAEAERVNNNTQRIVVRSSPVHRLSSLMEEESDLTAHAPVLSSCIAVVEKLRQKGQLTAKEEKKARSFLRLKEKPWPNQPEIEDGAELYLENLSISYFLHLGMLGKIKSAGLIPIASLGEISEANALITYEDISNEVNEVIEQVRTALSSRIETGSIQVGRRFINDESDELSMSEHPTVGVVSLSKSCDVIFIDDRFLNQRTHIAEGESQSQIASTLDLLDALFDSGTISKEERLECRTRLRQAGFAFIPINVEELTQNLNASEVSEDRVLESAELRSIRESILTVRMSDWLQLPKETFWLQTAVETFIRVLKSLWVDDANLAEVTARSNWLADLVDMRGWAHRLEIANGVDVVKLGPVAHIQMLLIPPMNVSYETRRAYWQWIEKRILSPIREQNPELYTSLVDMQKSGIAEFVEITETKLNKSAP